ncbi:MAG: hypothetical protein GY758_10750 [Fuerstiella sp.]|nr:hypothetical protein [Fuerstiella sp.]MCP4782964.1 hypothetical protein [Fuerstiella sp.]MCP4857857.1 hypothetical protein [Fuerstiella sp.]
MNPLIGQILEHDGDFENTALLGKSAPLILKRLYKAFAISNLWMWCETPVGTTAQSGLSDVTAALSRELEVALTLTPGTLLSVASQTKGNGAEQLTAMLKYAWRIPPVGLNGIVFCFLDSQIVQTDSVRDGDTVAELVRAFQAVQRESLPFVLTFVGTDENFQRLTGNTATEFFTKTVYC